MGTVKGRILVSIELKQLMLLISVRSRFHSRKSIFLCKNVFYMRWIIYSKVQLTYSTQCNRTIGLQSEIYTSWYSKLSEYFYGIKPHYAVNAKVDNEFPGLYKNKGIIQLELCFNSYQP